MAAATGSSFFATVPGVADVCSRWIALCVSDAVHCSYNVRSNVYRRSSSVSTRHSTKIAVLRVLSDILQVVNRGNSAALVLVDLSTAFDTIDHKILLQRRAFPVDCPHVWSIGCQQTLRWHLRCRRPSVKDLKLTFFRLSFPHPSL